MASWLLNYNTIMHFFIHGLNISRVAILDDSFTCRVYSKLLRLNYKTKELFQFECVIKPPKNKCTNISWKSMFTDFKWSEGIVTWPSKKMLN